MSKLKSSLLLDYLKVNLTTILIITLLFILFIQQCNSGGIRDQKIKRDTVWIHHDSVINSKPTVIKTIPVPYKERSIEYLPDTNYAKLVIQYNKLVDKYLESNLYKDSLKIDSIGYVLVTDTISKNLIKNRSFVYNIKYPKITQYIPEKKRNQVYYGGGIVLADQSLQSVTVGAILKTKKEHIWGVNFGINSQQQLIYGIQTYWKISLRKK